MPALPLSPEQKEDARRLFRLYEKWKSDQRQAGARASQEMVAAALGFASQSAVSQYIKGGIPLNQDAVAKFAKFFGVSPAEISPTISSQMAAIAEAVAGDITDTSDHAPIRLVDAKASAGKGEIVFSDDITKILMFRRDWLAKNDAKPDQTIGFEVGGDSMTDLHIIDGSVVLANRRRTDPLSKRVYVVWINGKLYVKELVKKDGMWWARSHNAARAADYPDILIDDPAARIVGRAFWCGFGL